MSYTSRCASRRDRLQRDADDLLVGPFSSAMWKTPRSASADPAAGGTSARRRARRRVQRIPVLPQRPLDEAVVRRIRHRREEPAVEHDRAELLVELVLVREPAGTSTKTTTSSATRRRLPRAIVARRGRRSRQGAYVRCRFEASEEHPWGEDVAKVRQEDLRLPRPARLAAANGEARKSHAHALSIDGAERTGYGLETRAGSPCRCARRA